MPLTLAPNCSHSVSDMDVATQADGLCPLCLQAEVERLRAALYEHSIAYLAGARTDTQKAAMLDAEIERRRDLAWAAIGYKIPAVQQPVSSSKGDEK